MGLHSDGPTWSKLAFIRTMLTRMKDLRDSRSKFTRQDFGGVRNLGVMKERYNLSPAIMSYYRRLHHIMARHLSIMMPLSKFRVGSSASGTNFWAAIKSKFGALSFHKSASLPTERNNRDFATFKYTLDVLSTGTLYTVIINCLGWFGAQVWNMNIKFWK